MKIMLDDGAFEPVRGHDDDAGMDLRTPVRTVVPKHGSAVIDTGVHVELPPGTFGKLESKSGLNVNHGIVSLGGVIDAGYTGPVKAKLYNMTGKDYIFERGDKVVQMIIQPCIIPGIMNVVDHLQGTARGDGGFGSTGR